MIILTDRREKQFRLDGFKYPVETVTLPIGDWSIKGFEQEVSIEYKTKCDLLQCLTQRREIKRFERELLRGKALNFFGIVVEAPFSDLAAGNGNGNRSRVSVAAALERLMAFCVRYRMPIFFGGNRNHSLWIVQSLLEKVLARIEQDCRASQKRRPRRSTWPLDTPMNEMVKIDTSELTRLKQEVDRLLRRGFFPRDPERPQVKG